MPTFLLNFLGSPKALLILFLLLVAGAVVWKYKSMDSKLFEQKVEITQLKERNAALKLDNQNRERANEELAKRLEDAEAVDEALDMIKEKIDASSEDEDGTVAPVLRDALNAINGVRNED